MKMVAERARVSVSAVSLALRNDPQIALPTRHRIQRVAREMGFTKSPVIAQLMSELRNSRTEGFQRSIGLLNAHPGVARLADLVSLPYVAEGCRRRAEASGYRCEEYWLNDPDLNPKELNNRLAKRGIRGVVVIGVQSGSDLLNRFAPTWTAHACVVAGAQPGSVPLSYCSTGFFLLARHAVENAIRLGYRRPALLVDQAEDRSVDFQLTAGMWAGQQRQLPLRDHVPPFLELGRAEESGCLFKTWFLEHEPDVLITFARREVERWLEDMGRTVPLDVGLIVLDRQKNSEGWACMDQQGDLLGELAIDLLASALSHGETGIPKVQRAATISGVWVHGDSVIDQNHTPVQSSPE